MESRGFGVELLADTLMTQTGVAQERTLTNFQPSRLLPAQRKAQIPREAKDQPRKDSWRQTMRLSEAGLRQRQTKALYPNHQSPPWLTEDAPRDHSNRLLDLNPKRWIRVPKHVQSCGASDCS